ncbi:PREDICTED: 60S ribosomal protein L23a-like [Condylura cristata]|uniref:60S ribosomal protein L23a-like n=1 Tax=Condylura cristata TaxID=143302 RepID=UPI000642C7B2|nr:PREDICTED: 60S ribosomal protein L23a-like [Condylura cristata]
MKKEVPELPKDKVQAQALKTKKAMFTGTCSHTQKDPNDSHHSGCSRHLTEGGANTLGRAPQGETSLTTINFPLPPVSATKKTEDSNTLVNVKTNKHRIKQGMKKVHDIN